MGANATPMPIGEVYTGLKTGLIDAAENNIPSYDGFKHYEAVKFYSQDRALDGARDAADEQGGVRQAARRPNRQMIREAAKESVAFQRKKWDEQEAKSLAVVKAGRRRDREVDKASFQKPMEPVYDKFITTPDLQRLVKAVQDTK